MMKRRSRQAFSSAERRSSSSRLRLSIVVVLLAAAVGLFFWQRVNIRGLFSRAEEPRSLQLLWDAQRYEEIRLQTAAILADAPTDQRALTFHGFAQFYLSTGVFTLEEKLPYIDAAISTLRMAQLLAPRGALSQIEYVLGKAYHFKGRYYADLTIEYLERSIESGYMGADTHEYLGLAYSTLANYEKSADYFQLAIDQEATDMRFLALAQAHINAGNTAEGETYLLQTIGKTEDGVVEQRARYLLAKIYGDVGRLAEAESEYHAIIDKNPRAADALYFLGEIRLKLGKPIEARAYWRDALIIDPNHYGARLRYYE